MNNVWMTADPHFWHTNIIRYESRPFSDVEAMNNGLIKNWNNKVKKEDTIFVMGDFALGSKDMIADILARLQGYKILILGNHDPKRKTMLELGFDEVYKYPLIYKEYFILSHQPVYLNNAMPYVNIHGHIHSQKMQYEGYFNVGVEHHNYAPVNFLDISAKYVISNTFK